MVKCTSKQIAWYLDKNIKQANTELVIPGFILRAKQDIKLAFVCGVFDGDGSNGRPLQLVSTVYLSYAQALQKLLYSCGLETRISETQDISRLLKGWRKIYRLNVITANTRKALIDCRHSVKTIELNEKSQRCNGFPSEWIKENKRKFGLYTNKQLNIDSYDSAFQKSNICPVEVIEVTNGNIGVETYDIEVANNEFFADGYLVHNSAQIALGDPDDYLFIRAKRWDLGNVPNWRALSNNTIYADDFSHISNDIWEGYSGNGEAYGLANIKLAQKVGRLGEAIKDPCTGFNPCAEITLGDGETCNLCELYLNNIKSKEELFDCAKLLYKTQKAINAMNFLHDETTRIVHKNMRIGVGVTGICQSFEKLEWLDECYKELRKFDKEWSKKKNWNESIKLTTVKPSGTLSLLAGATPGVHPAYSKYYIRRIRMAHDDALVATCKGLGYHTEFAKNFDTTTDRKTIIVSFPCFAGDKVIQAKEMSAIKQLELVKKMQTIWSDNAVSVTVYYKKEELSEIREWLKLHYKNSLKSVSFLLHNEHGFQQAPYEEISEETYKELIRGIKALTNIQEGGDLDTNECASGACPIK